MFHSGMLKAIRQRMTSRRRSNRPRRSRRACFEGLEDRTLMTASPVDVSAAGRAVIIDGTRAGDHVQVEEVGSSEILIQQLDGYQGRVIEQWIKERPDTIVFNGYQGNDSFQNKTTIYSVAFGGDDSDFLSGGSNGDRLDGGPGYDVVAGNDGNDLLVGGPDIDYVYGGMGDDDLYSHSRTPDEQTTFGYYPEPTYGYLTPLDPNAVPRRDELYGGEGVDHLYGFDDHEYLDGGPDTDYLFGEAGNDELVGGSGVDYLFGSYGNDELHGGSDRDWLYGEQGHDKLYGEGGSDILAGGDDNDWLFGGADQDFLYGESGDDYLSGYNHGSQIGDGHMDFLFGQQGNDTFVLPKVDTSVPHTIVKGVAVEDFTDYNAQEDNVEFRSPYWWLAVDSYFESLGSNLDRNDRVIEEATRI